MGPGSQREQLPGLAHSLAHGGLAPVTRWWDFAHAKVDDPVDFISGYDCDIEHRDYGPHKAKRPDNRGHSVTVENKKVEGVIWPIVTCECGWRDHAGNYAEHAATFPKREVMW